MPGFIDDMVRPVFSTSVRVSGGAVCPRLPRWPFCHLPGASQKRHPPTVPRRRRVTSRSAKKGRRSSAKRPPRLCRWCRMVLLGHVDLNKGSRRGCTKKSMTERDFEVSHVPTSEKSQPGRSAPLSKRCETRILATRPRHRFQEVLYTKRLYTKKRSKTKKKSSRKNYL